MKFPSTPAFLLTILTSLVVGGIGGWLGRGYFSDRPAAEASTGSAPAKLSSPSAAPTNPSEAQRLRSAHVAECNLTAKQLLQQVVDKAVPRGKEELFLARFRAAITSCDEAAVGEMVATLIANMKSPIDPFVSQDYALVGCARCLIMRMLALNPPKAWESLVPLVTGEMIELQEDVAQVLDALSENELTQAEDLLKPWLGTNSYELMELALLQARIKFDAEGVYQELTEMKTEGVSATLSSGIDGRKLLARLSLESPEKALRIMARYPQISFSSFRRDLVAQWFKVQPKEAEKWVTEQNQAETLSEWIGFLDLERHKIDGKWLRDKFVEIKADSIDARVRLAGDIAARSAETELEESLRWAATLPAEEQANANLNIFPEWLEQDAAAASAWLATWPAGKRKNQAITKLVRTISDEDPEAALRWAVNIQEKGRFHMMNEALNKWRAKDPAAAEKARQSLSEADRAALAFWREKNN